MIRTRAIALVCFGLLAAPTFAHASGFGRGGSSKSSGSKSSGSSSSGSNAHGAAPVGTPHQANAGGGYYRSGGSGRYYYGGGYYSGRYYAPGYYAYGYGGPYWWGWGVHPWGYYGYGYYPYYGGPAVVSEVGPRPPVVTSSIFVGGMFVHQGAGLNLSLAIDGKEWGFNLSGVTLPSVNPDDSRDITPMPLVSSHLTYSVISDMHLRVRVEGGIAGVGAPGVTYVGPDVGASAQLALVGPLAVSASAHWMPVPASIIDLQAGVGLNFGALGIQGGWRWVRLDDSSQCDDVGVSCGSDIFNGPQVSVGVIF
jgi:hypothetical protein